MHWNVLISGIKKWRDAKNQKEVTPCWKKLLTLIRLLQHWKAPKHFIEVRTTCFCGEIRKISKLLELCIFSFWFREECEKNGFPCMNDETPDRDMQAAQDLWYSVYTYLVGLDTLGMVNVLIFWSFLSHLLVAGCDIGVWFSVRLSTFMSMFDIYVKVSILINYKTKQPSNLAWNISLTSWLCDIGVRSSFRLSVHPCVCQHLCRCSTFMSKLVFWSTTRLNTH